MIAETLFKVAKELFGIFTTLDEKRLQRTIRVADYFSNLAQIIEDTSAFLKKGEYPHGECENLRIHAQMMTEKIKDIIGENVAEKYAAKVMAVWEIEQMHAELIGVDEDERNRQLKILDEAAGYFRAVAAHLRVTG
jgi:3-deoxy-D-arabino-heptulosonate 7-phosphate (DAHP) synthase class II